MGRSKAERRERRNAQVTTWSKGILGHYAKARRKRIPEAESYNEALDLLNTIVRKEVRIAPNERDFFLSCKIDVVANIQSGISDIERKAKERLGGHVISDLLCDVVCGLVFIFIAYIVFLNMGHGIDKEWDMHCRNTAKNVESCLKYGKD